MKAYEVRVAWDGEAKVWYVSDSDVPGLAGEAESVEEMIKLLQNRVPEMLEANEIEDGETVKYHLISEALLETSRHCA